MARPEGFTLLELLVVVAALAGLALLSLGVSSETLARQRVEAATRRVLLGLERGRLAAERQGRPCALALGSQGWQAPQAGALPGCQGGALELGEGVAGSAELRLEHNLPEAVRFSSNGLVLDGGTVVVGDSATVLRRCVVVSLPLGVTRVGLWEGGACRPDPAL